MAAIVKSVTFLSTFQPFLWSLMLLWACTTTYATFSTYISPSTSIPRSTVTPLKGMSTYSCLRIRHTNLASETCSRLSQSMIFSTLTHLDERLCVLRIYFSRYCQECRSGCFTTRLWSMDAETLHSSRLSLSSSHTDWVWWGKISQIKTDCEWPSSLGEQNTVVR